MAAAWNDLPATGGLHECAALVGSAEVLRVSAPELSVQLARRALLVGATDASAGNAGEARDLSMRAQALLASGLVRISQHPKAVEPGFAALALAESDGALDVAAVVRIDLAACAQQVGEPLLGGAILRPVLESVQIPPSVRATALGRLVGCVGHVARRDDIEDALSEADRLLAADNGITSDVRRMERARLAVRSAGYHRWYGDTEDAITAAREGLNLLTRLRSDLRSESDRLRARLSLELVCGLLDEGELHEAEAAAHPVVDEPVRATSAASVGRLMLALATRVYLPSGQTDRGRHLLDQAAWMAERHALDGLRADTLTEVSRLDEQAGRAGDALEALRSARAAEHRRMRAVSRAARIVLVEVGANHGVRDTTQQSVAALVRQLAHPAGLPAAVTAPPQVGPPPAKPSDENRTPSAAAELAGTVDMAGEGTRLLDREALFRRLRSVRTVERPVALTLVRLEANGDGGTDDDRGPDTGIMVGLADKVRDMAPDNAEVARADGGELAVILPATTRDQAEQFATTIRESDWASAKDMSISTGVVQTDQATTDAAGMLTAARDALTPAQTPVQNSAQAPAQTPAQTSAQAPVQTQTKNAESLAATSAALHSALLEDTPTRPLNARPAEQRPAEQGVTEQGLTEQGLTEQGLTGQGLTGQGSAEQKGGRSILSSLTIPSGSGGRRRAGEEQPPGAKSRWPAEPAEAPRWTRAERRAQQESTWPTDPTPTPPGGWPAPAEEPSQGKRAATPDKPSFSETVALTRTHLPAEPQDETTRRDLRTTAATGSPATTNEPARPPATAYETAPPTSGRHGPATPPQADEPEASRTTTGPTETPSTRTDSAEPQTTSNQPATANTATTGTRIEAGRPAGSEAANSQPTAATSATATDAEIDLGRSARSDEASHAAAASTATSGAGAGAGFGRRARLDEAGSQVAAASAAASGAGTGFGRRARSDEAGSQSAAASAAASGAEVDFGRSARSDEVSSHAAAASAATSGAGTGFGRFARSDEASGQAAGESPAASGAGIDFGRRAGSDEASSQVAGESSASLCAGAGFGRRARSDEASGQAAAASSSPGIDVGRSAGSEETSSQAAASSETSTPGTGAGLGRRARAEAASGSDGAPDVPAGRVFSTSGTEVDFGRPATSGIGAEREAAGGQDVPDVPAGRVFPRADAAEPDVAADSGANGSWGSGDGGFASGIAGLSSGGTLRASDDDAAEQRSSYEETKAELARMMSALNAKSLAARESSSNGARQSVPAPPAADDVPEPPDPVPAPPEPPPVSEPGQRSGLMAAFDALTGPLPGVRAEFDGAAELPARKPAKSWTELETSAVVESPADDLFGQEPVAEPETRTEVRAPEKRKFRSSLGAAFAEFGATEKKVTEPVKETVQETSYDEPIGPPPRPDNLPRRGERSSATIASLLTEALAAYQSTAEDAEEHRAPERFDSFVGDDAEPQQSGVRGRHRSPE